MANTERRRRPFKYQLATDGSGRYAAFSEVEPAFWVTRDSEASAVAAAEEIIRDYEARFGGAMKASRPITRNVAVHQFGNTREREVA